MRYSASLLILPFGIVLGSILAQITRARPRFIVVFTLLLQQRDLIE
jgi:hypothetical protein